MLPCGLCRPRRGCAATGPGGPFLKAAGRRGPGRGAGPCPGLFGSCGAACRSRTHGRQRLARNDLLLRRLLLHPIRRLLLLEGLLGRLPRRGLEALGAIPRRTGRRERLCARELLLAHRRPLVGWGQHALAGRRCAGWRRGIQHPWRRTFLGRLLLARRRPLRALLLLALGLLLLGERRLRLSEHERIRLPGRLGVRNARQSGKNRSAEGSLVGCHGCSREPFVQARADDGAASVGRARGPLLRQFGAQWRLRVQVPVGQSDPAMPRQPGSCATRPVRPAISS
jgi:hypothetical protein